MAILTKCRLSLTKFKKLRLKVVIHGETLHFYRKKEQAFKLLLYVLKIICYIHKCANNFKETSAIVNALSSHIVFAKIFQNSFIQDG